MCRLLAVVTADTAPLAVSLADVLPHFTSLSAFHRDGWGVAGADVDGGATVRKQAERAHADGTFGSAVGDVATDAGLIHLRWATPGLRVSHGNTHPFLVGDLAFAHNGSFDPVQTVWDDLVAADLRDHREGDTDSEAYFRAVLTRMRQTDAAQALIETADAIREKCAISGLNAVLLAQDALYVYAEHDPDSASARTHGTDYFPIRYRREPHRVIVSSTGYEPPGFAWSLLPERHVLRVERRSLDVDVIAPTARVAPSPVVVGRGATLDARGDAWPSGFASSPMRVSPSIAL